VTRLSREIVVEVSDFVGEVLECTEETFISTIPQLLSSCSFLLLHWWQDHHLFCRCAIHR
jgi:hypothetical protein